ncbi:MAG: hypothetical protein VCE75_15005 [Alphaproteobacteria bacterium]|jgi:hypothetical protein
MNAGHAYCAHVALDRDRPDPVLNQHVHRLADHAMFPNQSDFAIHI